MKQLHTLFFMLLVSVACSQPLKKFDPYFIETRDTVSTYGPMSIVRHILEDKKGNLWFASWQGIIKYDGKVFTNYTLKNNLIHFHVYSILEDSKGNIWFGTIRGGAYKYDGKSFTLFSTENGLTDDLVGDITEDKDGNIWFATDNGISRLDVAKKTFTNFTTQNGLAGDRVNSIIQARSGQLWIGTRSGVSVYDGKAFTHFVIDPTKAFTNVRSIKEDQYGNIWIGGQEGLYRYDPNTKSLSQLMPNFIGYIFEDKAGHLWLSAGEKEGMALYRYDGKTFNKIIEKNSGGDVQVFESEEDKNGNIWFGTMRGPCKYDGKTFTYFTK